MTILKSSSPLLAQTSRPPTRNLSCKTHDASSHGTTDNGIDDGIINADDRLRSSMMKVSMATMLGRPRWRDDVDDDYDDDEDGTNEADVEDDEGAGMTEPMI